MVLRITSGQNKIMFMNESLVDLYLLLPKGSLLEACNLTGVAYTHALKMIKYWISMNLIIGNKSGQQYNFFYTSTGNKLAQELSKTRTFMKKYNIQWCVDDLDID